MKLNGVARETPLEIYTPLAQDTGRSVAVVTRTSIDAEAALRSLTNLVKEMNGDLAVYDVSTIEHLLSQSMARQRVTATSSAIVGLFLRNGVVTAAIGIVLGGLGAYWLTSYLEGLLFGVKPADAVAFASGAGVLFGVALIACYVPAARAARVSPTIALRGE